jgi:HlyD family secretion protein
MRRLVPWIIAALVVAGLVWAFLPQPVAVELAEIGPRTIEVMVEEEGEAQIREVFTVSATIAGKLHRLNLHAGDPVIAGQTVVAEIGPVAPALLDARARAVAEAGVQAAKAAVDLARAQLAQAEATLEFMATEARRSTALFDRGAIAERVLDNAVLEEKTAAAARDSAQANLTVRERELESARAVLEAADNGGTESCCIKLTAPVSGRVLRVVTENEQVVQPGQPIVEIGDPADLEIAVDLLSRDAVRVAAGAKAVITGWGGAPLAAHVRRVDPSAETRVSALGIDEQRVEVILDLDGAAEDRQLLGHGYRVIAQIALWRGEDVLAIPIGALFRDGSDWASFVAVDGRVELRSIMLGERNGDYAQVLEGLQAGDQVILHPSDQIAEGVRIVAD